MQKQDSEKIGVISINSISDVATASEREKKCISRREGDADTRFTLAVSAASEDPQRYYIGLDPCAKHISKQAADLRSIDEEKIKTREAHRRRDSKVYIVYIYYIIIFFII